MGGVKVVIPYGYESETLTYTDGVCWSTEDGYLTVWNGESTGIAEFPRDEWKRVELVGSA